MGDGPVVVAERVIGLADVLVGHGAERRVVELLGDAERAQARLHRALRIADRPARVRHHGGNAAEADVVAELLGHRCRGPQRLEHLRQLARDEEGVPQLEAQVHALLERLARHRQVPHRGLGLSEVGGRFDIGRARGRLVPGLAQVAQRALPLLAVEGVQREPLHVQRGLIGVARLDRVRDGGVERAPAVVEQPLIGHVVGEAVAERPFDFGEEARLVEEAGALEAAQPLTQLGFGQLDEGLEDRQREGRADDRGALEDPLVSGIEPIDARGQHGVHARRDPGFRQRSRELVGARRAREHAELDETAHALLEEERIASGALAQEALEG